MVFLDPNNPQVQALIKRNPNGVLASLMNRKVTSAAPSNNVAGSNNAGGLMPGATPSSPGMPNTASGFSFGSRGQSGIYSNGSMSNPMNSMPQYGGPTSGSNNPFMSNAPTSFAAGGMMTDQGTAVRPGMPMPPSAGTGRTLPSARFKVDAQEPQYGSPMQSEPALGAAGPAPLEPAQIEQEAQRFVQEHPEEAQKVQALIAMAIQTGELTSQELNTMVQLAKTALANPAAYPQIRQFAIKNGLGTEQDIPQQLDQGLLYVLIVAGKSASAAKPQGNAMGGQGPAPTMENGVLPEYKDGGMTGNTPHLAKVHPREYVIPEDTLIYHGKKHFDKLVEQARTPPDANKAN